MRLAGQVHVDRDVCVFEAWVECRYEPTQGSIEDRVPQRHYRWLRRPGAHVRTCSKRGRHEPLIEQLSTLGVQRERLLGLPRMNERQNSSPSGITFTRLLFCTLLHSTARSSASVPSCSACAIVATSNRWVVQEMVTSRVMASGSAASSDHSKYPQPPCIPRTQARYARFGFRSDCDTFSAAS